MVSFCTGNISHVHSSKPLGTVELAIILLGVVLSPQCKSAAIESPGRDTSLEKGRL